MNGFNLSNIIDANLGATSLSSIYLGSTKLWPLGHDYSQDYFTIESLEDNNLIKLTSSSTTKRYITYKTSPTALGNPAESGTSNYGTTFITLNTGDKVYIYVGDSWATVTTSDYTYFESSKTVNVYGNVNSVRDRDFKTNYTMSNQTYFYYRLFYKLKIVDASNLVFPYTTLRNYCYANMFEGCTTLTNAPSMLSATSVSSYGYTSMFKGCTSLTEPPQLGGTTLAGYAYSSMFEGCTSLSKLPKINHVTTITYWAPFRNMYSGCTAIVDARYDVDGNRLLPDHLNVTGGGSAYELMFNGCTGLIYAPELTETSPHTGEYNQMFKYCSNSSFTELYTHATSLGTNYFNQIVNGTYHQGTVYKADDVTWDSAQYSQFVYNSVSNWTVSNGGYNSGEYQT